MKCKQHVTFCRQADIGFYKEVVQLIKNRIKVLRAERDWTQADLAEKAGISRQAVVSIEKYKYTPSLELAFKIAEVFSLSIQDVFTYKEDEDDE